MGAGKKQIPRFARNDNNFVPPGMTTNLCRRNELS